MDKKNNDEIDADLSALFREETVPATGRRCRKCGAAAGTDPRIRFCAYCGGALEAPPAKKVLIVDDSSLSRKTIAAVLQQLGCEVLEASDGAAALQIARTQTLALVVLDVVMPGMSGLDFLAALKEPSGSPKPPVVMLTSKADLSTVHQALSSGAGDYLLKHSAPEEIRQRLKKHLAP